MRGDMYTLKKYMMHAQFRQDFNIAENRLRNLRNILIVAATPASRAAIEGGPAPAKAFDLSDMYRRSVESLYDAGDIHKLMARMVFDFTARVGTCLIQHNATPAVASCLRWISRNITQPVTLADVAGHVRMSPGYLPAVFRKEAGLSVSEYITEQRIKEAGRMLYRIR